MLLMMPFLLYIFCCCLEPWMCNLNKFTGIQKEEWQARVLKRFNLLCLECDNSDLIV